LLAIAVTITVALFGVGVAIGQATTESTRVAAPPVVGVRSEVAGAVVERTNAADPAPTGHLVVVTVAATSCGVRSVGSGVLVDDDLLVTAAHVVGDAGLVRIDHDGQVLTGEVLGVLADGRDLALIELDASMARPLRSVAAIAPSDPITLVGHPNDGPRTVLVGARTDVPQLASQLYRGELVAASVSVPPGMSGGPAVDASGALIGITVAEETGTQTAIVVRIDDPAALVDAAVQPGRCPLGA